jgi:hypothetical protein
MRVMTFAIIVNAIIFVANMTYMDCISKEVYKNLKRFAKFKCLTKEFEEYDTLNSKYCGGFFTYLMFAIPVINVITLFISCADYDNIVKDIQKTTINEFMIWVENNKT